MNQVLKEAGLYGNRGGLANGFPYQNTLISALETALIFYLWTLNVRPMQASGEEPPLTPAFLL